MDSKRDNIEIMMNDKADKIIEEHFDSLKNRYQKNNFESMKGSESVFDNVHLLYYECHKINLNRGGLYIDCPDWIKNKKATINSINKKDNKCFQYTVVVSLNHEEIGKKPERITKIKLFINKYEWEGINFPSAKDEWKRFEKNNVTIALNVLYAKKEIIYPAYVSTYNSNCEKQVILLMISNRKTMALSCSKKSISIIKRNNFETSW